MNKASVISGIYYDRAGYGSIKTTWQDAKKKDSSITIKNVRDWFSNNIEQKKEQRGYNSFITPHAHFEYQLDLFFINDLPDQKFKVGLIMIDHFSKYMVVVPIKTKTEGDVASGILEAFNKMKHKPKMLYTDDEGSFSSNAMKKYYDDNNIKHVITRGHAAVAERGIRTFKDALYKRIDNNKGSKSSQWTDYIYEILLTYNSKLQHNTTGMTPDKALNDNNRFDVWLNTFLKSKQERKYTEINIGDKVKIYRKKKVGEKERTSVWSDISYEVVGVSESLGQMYYKLQGVSKEYLRHELLKV